MKQFKRIPERSTEAFLGGVCGGVGYHLGIDPLIVRLVTFVGFCVAAPFTIITYLLIWWLTPEFDNLPEDYDK